MAPYQNSFNPHLKKASLWHCSCLSSFTSDHLPAVPRTAGRTNCSSPKCPLFLTTRPGRLPLCLQSPAYPPSRAALPPALISNASFSLRSQEQSCSFFRPFKAPALRVLYNILLAFLPSLSSFPSQAPLQRLCLPLSYSCSLAEYRHHSYDHRPEPSQRASC